MTSPSTPTRTAADAPVFAPGTPLRGEGGLAGEVEQTAGDNVIARLADGTRILLRADTLRPDGDGGARVDLSHNDIDHARDAHHPHPHSHPTGDTPRPDMDMVIPTLEERVHVDTEKVETGRVRVVKRVHTEEHEIEEPVARQEVRVERVPVGRVVEDATHPPQARQAGETLIIPLLEEVLVVEKRLVLREELHITRDTSRTTERRKVALRKEEAQVQRQPPTP